MTGRDGHVVKAITGFPVGNGLQWGEGGSRGSLAVAGVIQAREERWVRLGDRGMERNECIWGVVGGRIEVGEEGVILLRVFVPSSFLVEMNAFRHIIYLVTSSKYDKANFTRIQFTRICH